MTQPTTLVETTEASPAVTAEDIEAAAARLIGRTDCTPLLESPLLNRRLGLRLLVKAECLQRTGSFKVRGATNRLALIPPEHHPRGVLAYSSGNHAQGVAAAAAALGMPATIVMPADAPAIKRRNTEAWGARIVTYDRLREDREAIGTHLAIETGATLVKPYDDPAIIAGQGTVGLELLTQCAALGVRPDAILIPCSGGGLTAGIAIIARQRARRTDIIAVEPAGFDDTARSLAAGERLRNGASASSRCDALLAPEPGVLTFAINRSLAVQGVTVSEAETARAVRLAFDAFKVVVEPGGAVALAAALSGSTGRFAGGTIVAVASGGNVDADPFAALLAEGAM